MTLIKGHAETRLKRENVTYYIAVRNECYFLEHDITPS